MVLTKRVRAQRSGSKVHLAQIDAIRPGDTRTLCDVMLRKDVRVNVTETVDCSFCKTAPHMEGVSA